MVKPRTRTVEGGFGQAGDAGRASKVARSKRRRTWTIRPATRPHSTPKGKKGYDRRREPQVEFD